MAVVIRLQGLRVTAGSEDIRTFFSGLKIPDGGVHIIGGEFEEAFIIFVSDEDARRAMTRSGGCIKGSPVNLLLSSKSEMQNRLEASTKKPEMTKKRPYKEGFKRRETEAPPPSSSSSFNESLSVEIRRTSHPEMGDRSGQDPHGGPSRSFKVVHLRGQERQAASSSGDEVYLLLQGMPFSVTDEDVRIFFQGLLIDDLVLTKNRRGQHNGKGVVKFGTPQDAREGLKRHKEYIGSRFVEVYTCTEEQWFEAGGGAMAAGPDRRGPSPAYTQRRPQGRARSRSPVAYKSKSSSPNEDLCILMENLSYSVQKRDVKELFHSANLHDDQIQYLDSDGKRTRALFVLFRSLRDYCAALTHHKQPFLNRCVSISPVSKEKMVAILESDKYTGELSERSNRSQEKSSWPLSDPYDSERMCLYVRNLPFDVRKVEIVDFFLGFRISEDGVVLLHDDRGAGLGEALVIFQSEKEAMSAQSLNGQRFLGSELILKCISRSQMREFGVADPEVQVQTPRERSSERYSARSSEAGYSRDMEYSDFRVTPDDHMPRTDLQVHIHGGSHLGSHREGPGVPHDGGNGFGPSSQQFDGPTCLKLVNLPLQISIDEIYDFCYGYRVIPGSVSLQYNKHGVPKGSATVVFESRQEALTAVEELSGRPIGTRKIQLVFV